MGNGYEAAFWAATLSLHGYLGGAIGARRFVYIIIEERNT
jgi:hypothetical protein